MKQAKGREKKNSISPDVKEATEKSLTTFCDRRVPSHVKNQVRIDFAFLGLAVTLFECRPPSESLRAGQIPEFPRGWTRLPIAQFRYDPGSGLWYLYGADRNDHWHPHDEWGGDVTSSTDIETLLAEVDEDPTGIFWG